MGPILSLLLDQNVPVNHFWIMMVLLLIFLSFLLTSLKILKNRLIQRLLLNIKSNHPPNIIKHLPASINRRISDDSCNEHEFNKAKPIYDDALKSSGYTEMLSFNKHRHPVRPRNKRRRNIVWYNLPFSKSL